MEESYTWDSGERKINNDFDGKREDRAENIVISTVEPPNNKENHKWLGKIFRRTFTMRLN